MVPTQPTNDPTQDHGAIGGRAGTEPPLPRHPPPSSTPQPQRQPHNAEIELPNRPISPNPIEISVLVSTRHRPPPVPQNSPPSQIRQTGMPNRPNFTRSRDFPPTKSTTQPRASLRGLSLIFAAPLHQQRPTGHRGENELTVPRAEAPMHNRRVTTIHSHQINSIPEKHPKTLDSPC